MGYLAHARRKFDEVLKTQPKKNDKQSLAFEALKRYDALFGNEGHANDLSIDERDQLRQTKSNKLVDAFFDWIQTIRSTDKIKYGETITYCLNQKRALQLSLEDG